MVELTLVTRHPRSAQRITPFNTFKGQAITSLHYQSYHTVLCSCKNSGKFTGPYAGGFWGYIEPF
jgi:hypothetical protein